MDLRTQFKLAIDAAQKFSALAQYHDKLAAAAKATEKRCGNCALWLMRGVCPQEPGMGSGKRGPSMNDVACGKFDLADSALRLQAERREDANQFAARHGLIQPARLTTVHQEP